MKQIYQLSQEQANLLSSDVAESIGRQEALLKQFSLILTKLDGLKPELDNTGRFLFDGLKAMAASRQEENAFLKRLEKLQLVFENISSSFHMQEKGNLRLQEQQNRALEYFENLDTTLLEMTVKHEISQLSNKTIREVKSSLANEFRNQKVRLIYILAGAFAFFLFGVLFTLFLKKILA